MIGLVTVLASFRPIQGAALVMMALPHVAAATAMVSGLLAIVVVARWSAIAKRGRLVYGSIAAIGFISGVAVFLGG